MKKLRKVLLFTLTAAAILSLTSCGGTNTADTEADTTATAEQTVTLKGITDLTPHSELIEFVRPTLEEQGIYIDLVATLADATTNERLTDGEIDFNFFQHLPYLEEYNEINGEDLVSAGEIHIEPLTAYSDKYDSAEDLPDNATVVIPSDATNEYRALKILEDAGFIKLRDDLTSLQASTADIAEYIKPIEITEIVSDQVIEMSADFDFYIVNTNKAIEAGIDTTKYLFRESSDSPYANIIAVRAEDADNPAIIALVEALRSDETKQFIEENYGGAVIPAK